MKKSEYIFSDGTPMKKWHRVFLSHIWEYTLSKEQAKEIVKLNPYLKKHANDFEKCFDELYIFSGKEYPHHLEDYKREVLKIK